MDKLNLFELFAKITLDDSEYNEKVRQSSTAGSKLAETLKNGLAVAGKAAAAGLAAASAAAVALGKASLDSYAEYEQLVGGVDTLFKESSQKLQEYAANAYQTAGMSANDYMSTVTSFSAALINSLGGDTEAAADMADEAVTAMADNANKMGTSIDSIVQTYQSLSRGNFAMLDNLKLGYGGTKEELERLLDDAEAYKESMGEIVNYDVSNFADIVSAIGAIQEKMGIAGATAAEASSTIEGSVASMKAAWSNLVTGIADENSDLDSLVGKFVDSVGVAADNVVPRITKILTGLGEAITQIAPVLANEVPVLLEKVLPSMVNAGTRLFVGFVTGMISALPNLVLAVPSIIDSFISAVSENLSSILDSGKLLLETIVTGIQENAPEIKEAAISMISDFGNYVRENLPTLIQAGLEAITSFTSGLRENVGVLVDGALDLMVSFAAGIADSIPIVIEQAPLIVSNLANTINDNAPKILEAAVKIIAALGKGLIQSIPALVSNIPQIIAAIVDTFLAFNWVNLGGSIIKGLGSGISGMVSFIKNTVNQVASAVKGGISSLPSAMTQIGKNIVQGLWNGIKSMISWIKSKAKEFVGGIVGGIKETLGIHSPSRVFSEIGENMALGLGEGWTSEYGRIKSTIDNGMKFETATIDVKSSGLGNAFASSANSLSASDSPIIIIVQSVLDGKVIGETSYQYARNKERAYGY